MSQTVKILLFSLVSVFSAFSLSAAGEDPSSFTPNTNASAEAHESDDDDLLDPNDFHKVTIITRGPGPENIFTFSVKTLAPGCTCLLNDGRTSFALHNQIDPSLLKIKNSTFVFTSLLGREINVVCTPENINAQLEQYKERNMLPVRIEIELVKEEAAPEPASSCAVQ